MSKGIPTNLGKLTLFFGCRNREEDYIYSEEVFDQNSSGVYTAVFEAFSREDVKSDNTAQSKGVRSKHP